MMVPSRTIAKPFRLTDLPLELQRTIIEFAIKPWDIEIRPRQLFQGRQDRLGRLFGTKHQNVADDPMLSLITALDARPSTAWPLLQVSKHFLEQAKPIVGKAFSGTVHLLDQPNQHFEGKITISCEALPYVDRVAKIKVTQPAMKHLRVNGGVMVRMCKTLKCNVQSISFPPVVASWCFLEASWWMGDISLEEVLNVKFDHSWILHDLKYAFRTKLTFEEVADLDTRVVFDLRIKIYKVWTGYFLEVAVPGDVLAIRIETTVGSLQKLRSSSDWADSAEEFIELKQVSFIKTLWYKRLLSKTYDPLRWKSKTISKENKMLADNIERFRKKMLKRRPFPNFEMIENRVENDNDSLEGWIDLQSYIGFDPRDADEATQRVLVGKVLVPQSVSERTERKRSYRETLVGDQLDVEVHYGDPTEGATGGVEMRYVSEPAVLSITRKCKEKESVEVEMLRLQFSRLHL